MTGEGVPVARKPWGELLWDEWLFCLLAVERLTLGFAGEQVSGLLRL